MWNRFAKKSGGELAKSLGIEVVGGSVPCYSVSHAFAMISYAILSQFAKDNSWKFGQWSAPASQGILSFLYLILFSSIIIHW